MPKKQTVYLVDGSALIYRAFFAFIRNPLINSKGEDTSATFGFVNSVLKLIKDEHPDYLAIVFDTKAPTFRHERYEEYKSTRAKMPDELVAQLPRIFEAVEALNIPCFSLDGYEADDIIGTMAKRAEREGFEVWCVTGDKDYYQLVTESCRIYNPKEGLGTIGKVRTGGGQREVWRAAGPGDRQTRADGRQLRQCSRRAGNRPEDGDFTIGAIWDS